MITITYLLAMAIVLIILAVGVIFEDSIKNDEDGDDK
jgi:hypothetical protein